eukprot:TRINITY_DN20962_c0_g1_i1.p1 TRINITY_DN20962_c0_g1~~TRINITY_DN20962_c0_g1_i1.p1  ORF type:complete len:101 (+),score=12.94 TRINITY_DN20962_c0_g1_i1:9-311(+)
MILSSYFLVNLPTILHVVKDVCQGVEGTIRHRCGYDQANVVVIMLRSGTGQQARSSMAHQESGASEYLLEYQEQHQQQKGLLHLNSQSLAGEESCFHPAP